MHKEFIQKRAAIIKFQMESSKSLGYPESTVRYYRNWPDVKEIRMASKFHKKYIDKIYEMTSKEITKEMPGSIIAIKINNKLKKDNILDKNRKF